MGSKTIRGDRLHIGFFGKRNAGKSSLINVLTGQNVSIVSDTPGTTADPVYKSMELRPVGPVVIIDTAGLDDTDTPLGQMRTDRSRKILRKCQFGIVVVTTHQQCFELETELIGTLEKMNVPYLIVANKSDLGNSPQFSNWQSNYPTISVSALKNSGIENVRERLIESAPRKWEKPYISDIVFPGDVVILVTPIDMGAPRGRLIMPQVKAIREIIDADAIPIICKERELQSTLRKLTHPPSLVVCDSQVFNQVDADIPPDIPLTSFSILSARQKGDLPRLIEGAKEIDNLKPDDHILIAESCSHHATEDDIAKVKIPRWLQHRVGGRLNIHTSQGSDFPETIETMKLIVHCGACTLNRIEFLSRIESAVKNRIPITNFGILIAYLKGVFPRAIAPFPECRETDSASETANHLDIKTRMAVYTDC